MNTLEQIREALPEAAKDIKLNLQSVLAQSSLSPAQKWGVAVASALATRNADVRRALVAEAKKAVGTEVLDDAIAAAALMGMNNVYYRFRHMAGKKAYSEKPARLRMNRLVRPLGNKVDFELYCLAVSAINACESCIRSHERAVVEGGLSEDQVHDAVRIAATVQAAAVALEAAEVFSAADPSNALPTAMTG